MMACGGRPSVAANRRTQHIQRKNHVSRQWCARRRRRNHRCEPCLARKESEKSGPKWWLISLIAVIVAVAVVIGVTLAFGGKKDDKSASSSNQYADTVTIGLKLAPTNLDIRNTAGSALDQILIGNVYEGIVHVTPRTRSLPPSPPAGRRPRTA